MLNSVVDQLVYLLLVVGQSHHTKAQQRNLFARTLLLAIGHAVLSHSIGTLRRYRTEILGKHLQRLHHRHCECGTHTLSYLLEKRATTHVGVWILFFHSLIVFELVLSSYHVVSGQ